MVSLARSFGDVLETHVFTTIASTGCGAGVGVGEGVGVGDGVGVGVGVGVVVAVGAVVPVPVVVLVVVVTGAGSDPALVCVEEALTVAVPVRLSAAVGVYEMV